MGLARCFRDLPAASSRPRSVGNAACSVNGPFEPMGRRRMTPGFAMVAATNNNHLIVIQLSSARLRLCPLESVAAAGETVPAALAVGPAGEEGLGIRDDGVHGFFLEVGVCQVHVCARPTPTSGPPE